MPDRDEMRAALAQLTRRLCGSVQAGLDDRRQMLDALASANVLQNPSAWLSPRRQALRNTVQSLTHSAERRILNEKSELAALVYEYQFTDEYDLSDEDIKQSVLDALKEGCEENASTFEDIADTLESEVGLSGVHVRLVYLNGDGSEIYTHDFE